MSFARGARSTCVLLGGIDVKDHGLLTHLVQICLVGWLVGFEKRRNFAITRPIITIKNRRAVKKCGKITIQKTGDFFSHRGNVLILLENMLIDQECLICFHEQLVFMSMHVLLLFFLFCFLL